MKTYSVALLLGAMTCSMFAAANEPVTSPETTAKAIAMAKGALWSANESIGTNVVNASGEKLGKVEDIVLDRDSARITYVIVSYGGILGVGNKHFAVPWQAFGQTPDRELSLQIDQEQLKNAPGFEKGTLPNTTDPMFHEGIHTFYKTEPYSLKSRKEARSDQAGAQGTPKEGIFDWSSWVGRGSDTTWARRLGELLGTKIENTQGETIAELEDVIVDTREARAAYAVVSFGGTWGFFEDTAIIPWNALRLDMAREAYVTDATKAQLNHAKLSDTEYRTLEDRKNSESLFSSFRTQPYWEQFGYESEADKSKRTAASQEKAEDRNFVSGTVSSVTSYDTENPEKVSERGVRVRVRAEDGSVRTVHFASDKELQREDMTIERGDTVEITGERRDYRGREVLLAHKIKSNGKTITLEN